MRKGSASRLPVSPPELSHFSSLISHFYALPLVAPGAPVVAPWQFLYFLPLPQGQGSLRPTFWAGRFFGRLRPSPPSSSRLVTASSIARGRSGRTISTQ